MTEASGAGVPSHPKSRPGWLLRRLYRLPPLLYRVGLAGRLGRRFLLLTMRGRKTGRPYTCGLNYVEDADTIYVFSGHGQTDWYRNVAAGGHVQVQIGRGRWSGQARPVTDRSERRRALALLRRCAADQGPPRALRPLLRLLGLDYDAEVRRLADPELDLPTVAIRVC